MKSTFKVLFYLKKGSEKKNGEVMIMARITIDANFASSVRNKSIQPDNWSIAAGKAKGRDAGRINGPFGRHTFFPEYHLPTKCSGVTTT